MPSSTESLSPLDEHGISRFQLLQNALNTSANLRYCAFDIMFLDGKDLRDLPLVERKKRLKAVLPKHPLLIYSEHWPEHGKQLYHEAEKVGLEGVMAKRARSRYLSDARSRDWLKIKTGKRQEAVIVGFTAPRRTRLYFGALVLAVRGKGDWRYVGRVGTGFSHAMLKELHAKLWPICTRPSPIATHPTESHENYVMMVPVQMSSKGAPISRCTLRTLSVSAASYWQIIRR
jgi:bifunctional non-homologous end joining protein LigD